MHVVEISSIRKNMTPQHCHVILRYTILIFPTLNQTYRCFTVSCLLNSLIFADLIFVKRNSLQLCEANINIQKMVLPKIL